MRQETTITEEREKDIEIVICDKCGLEAEEPVELYPDIVTNIFENTADRPVEFASRMKAVWDNPGAELDVTVTSAMPALKRAYTFDLEPNRAYIEYARDPDPVVEICQSCFEEVFGWANDG